MRARAGYAEGTDVSVERTKSEIVELLRRNGASQRGTFDDDDHGQAVLWFVLDGRHVRLQIPLPKMASFKTKPAPPTAKDQRPRERTPEEQRKVFEQACRERWRAMLLVVKAKLELVRLGASTVEEQFLADVQMPDGRRLIDALRRPLDKVYETGNAGFLLPEKTGDDEDDERR